MGHSDMTFAERLERMRNREEGDRLRALANKLRNVLGRITPDPKQVDLIRERAAVLDEAGRLLDP